MHLFGIRFLSASYILCGLIGFGSVTQASASLAPRFEIYEHSSDIEIHLMDLGPGQSMISFQSQGSHGSKEMLNAFIRGTCSASPANDRNCEFQYTLDEERIEVQVQFIYQSATQNYQLVIHQEFFDRLSGSFIDFKRDEIDGFKKTLQLQQAKSLPPLLVGDFRKQGDDLIEIRFSPESLPGQYSVLVSWQDSAGQIDKEHYFGVSCFGQSDRTTFCFIDDSTASGRVIEMIFKENSTTGLSNGTSHEIVFDPSTLEYQSSDTETIPGWIWVSPI